MNVGSGEYYPWAGDAFEKIIEKNYDKINNRLGMVGDYKACWWKEKKDRKYIGPEIDLVIRPGKKEDTPVYVIEAKYTSGRK